MHKTLSKLKGFESFFFKGYGDGCGDGTGGGHFLVFARSSDHGFGFGSGFDSCYGCGCGDIGQ